MSANTSPPSTGAASPSAIVVGSLLVAAATVLSALAAGQVEPWLLAVVLWATGLLIVSTTFGRPLKTDDRGDRVRVWLGILIAPLFLPAVALMTAPDDQTVYRIGMLAAVLVAAGLVFTRPLRGPWPGTVGAFLVAAGLLTFQVVILGFIAHRYRLFPTPERAAELVFATAACCAVVSLFIVVTLRPDALGLSRLRGKWTPKDAVTIGISCLALIVSIVSFAYPVIRTATFQNAAAETYFKYLGANNEFAVSASEHYADAGSPAALFAATIGDIWRSQGYATANPGSAYSGGDSVTKFRVCFPTLETLPIECAVASDFVFAESGKIRDFTLDGIPVGALIETEENSEREPVGFSGDTPWAAQVQVQPVSLMNGFDPEWAQFADVPQPNARTAVFVITNASDRELALSSFTIYGGVDVDDVTWTLNDIPAGDSRYLAVRSPQDFNDFEVCLRAQTEEACAPLAVRG